MSVHFHINTTICKAVILILAWHMRFNICSTEEVKCLTLIKLKILRIFENIHHVDNATMHLYAHTKQEGKKKLVFLKQAAAHIAIQAECEKVVDV